MSYESLKLLFYKDSMSDRYQNVEELLKLRLEAESTFRTHIQTPSGELFLAVPRELSLLNEKVLRHERKIEALKRSLPPLAQGAMVRDLVINEVVSTNELEGVYSTRRQINELLESESFADSEPGGKRFRELVELYLGLYDQKLSKPTKLEDIRSLYALSLSRVIAENRDTYYRSFRDAEHPLNHGELTHNRAYIPKRSKKSVSSWPSVSDR